MFIRVTKESGSQLGNVAKSVLLNTAYIICLHESGDANYPYAVVLSNGKTFLIKEDIEKYLITYSYTYSYPYNFGGSSIVGSTSVEGEK